MFKSLTRVYQSCVLDFGQAVLSQSLPVLRKLVVGYINIYPLQENNAFPRVLNTSSGSKPKSPTIEPSRVDGLLRNGRASDILGATSMTGDGSDSERALRLRRIGCPIFATCIAFNGMRVKEFGRPILAAEEDARAIGAKKARAMTTIGCGCSRKCVGHLRDE
eukprot:1134897-Amorphochlora_amoeboformis.AAC.2